MGIFRNVWQSRYNIGDNLSSYSIRSRNFVSGFFYGRGTFYYMRASLKSFYSRELIDIRDIKKYLRLINKYSRHLASFDESKIAKWSKRYSSKDVSDVNRFNKKVEKLAVTYSGDLQRFILAYGEFLKSVNDGLVRIAIDRYKENLAIDSLIGEITSVLKDKQKQVIPDEMIKEAIREFLKLVEEKEKTAKKSYDEIARELREKPIKKGFLGWLSPSGNYFVHKGKRIIKRSTRRMLEELIGNITQIRDQISSKTIQLDILNRLTLHFKNLEKFDLMLRELAHDIRVLIEIVDKDYKKAIKKLTDFLSVCGNIGAVKTSKIPDGIAKLNELHDEIQVILKSDAINQRSLYQSIKFIGNSSSSALRHLRDINEQIRAGIQKNPAEALRRFQ